MKKSILEIALRTALKELSSHPEFENYLHWSFIVSNNSIIEWATNNNGNNIPIHFGYHARLNWDGQPKTHAEFAAFKRARGLLTPNKKFECVNIRLNRRGEIRMAAPCSCCSAFLCEMGCSKFYFTTAAGWAKSHI
jgi:hypothetical protein